MFSKLGEKVEEKAMVEFFKRFDKEPFRLKFKDDEYLIGKGEPTFTVNFKNPIPVSELAKSVSIALGEAYMNGNLVIEGDLYQALTHFLGQIDDFPEDHKFLHNILHPSLSKKKQAEEVQSHYDIGNDFYKLWLDDTMSYSCAYFKHPDDTLYQAQVNKVDYILQKLHLEEGMTLLDIGCGWGFLLIEAAKKYKIKGMGITLSHEQYAEFEKRIAENHLEDYLTVKLMDYRDLPKSGRVFDRIVSVGMLEHVGRENYQLFCDSAASVLKEGGLFLLHFISQIKEVEGSGWMQKYIFPGGVIPSLREMVTAVANDDLHVLDIENLRMHYNKTLLCWDKNYHEHLDVIKNMFDERFIRMWDLYLAGCAAAFYVGNIELHQILVSKGINNDLPITRWY